MSTISASTFLEHLDKWGVEYVEHSRHDRCLGRGVPWHQHEARRGRDCAQRGWNAHGIAIHHSGGPTSWQFVWDGRSDVPGPLYTAIIYPDGVAHLTGWTITNNVGSCDDAVRNRVLRGDMPTNPSTGNVSPGADDYFAANSEFYGFSYRGTAPNAAQRRTALLMSAAVCDAHGSGWDGGSVAGHRELTRRKPDPAGENMSDFRSDVNTTLAAGPGGTIPDSGGTMSWNEDLSPGTPGNDITGRADQMLPASWPRGAADILGYAGAGGSVLMRPEILVDMIFRTDHAVKSPSTYPGRDSNPHWYVERYLVELWDMLHALRTVPDELEALRQSILGGSADEIKALITTKHDEAAQQRQVIADTLTTKLDSIADAVQGSDPAEAKLATIREILRVPDESDGSSE